MEPQGPWWAFREHNPQTQIAPHFPGPPKMPSLGQATHPWGPGCRWPFCLSFPSPMEAVLRGRPSRGEKGESRRHWTFGDHVPAPLCAQHTVRSCYAKLLTSWKPRRKWDWGKHSLQRDVATISHVSVPLTHETYFCAFGVLAIANGATASREIGFSVD